MALDMQKLQPLLGTLVNELGAAVNASLVLIGDKLGLYRALVTHGPLDSTGLAAKTGTHERYVREWLSAQAASGFITYDAAAGTFFMSPEQTAVLADDDSTFNMMGGFYSLAAVYADEPKLTSAFKSGDGVGWGEHNQCLFCGTERFFRPGYKANLVSHWLPTLNGIVAKLEAGARVADVGCGHGASTIVMGEAFPRSEFVGIDFHDKSVEHANATRGKPANVRFEVGRAQDFGGAYDFVTIFDALHDMGDPVGAAANIRKRLSDGGTLMVVEPLAGDRLEDNLHPIGRVYYGFSTAICVPCSLKQEVGAALGAQAGEARLTEVLREAGFTKVRRAAETPFNMVLEARV